MKEYIINGHEQKIDNKKFELYKKCKNNQHDYCCGDYEEDYIGHEDECNPIEIIKFACGCEAYVIHQTNIIH